MTVKPKSAISTAIKAVFNFLSRSAPPARSQEARPPVSRAGPGTMPVHTEQKLSDHEATKTIEQLSREGKPHADVPFDIQ